MVEGGPGAGAGGTHALPRFSTKQPGPMRMGLKWVGAGGLVELSVVGSPPVAVGESDLHLSDACATGPACFGDAANVHGICAHACRRLALACCVQWQEHALVVAADTHRRSNLTLQPRDGGLRSRKSKDSCASRLSPCTAKHSSGMGVETARGACLRLAGLRGDSAQHTAYAPVLQRVGEAIAVAPACVRYRRCAEGALPAEGCSAWAFSGASGASGERE